MPVSNSVQAKAAANGWTEQVSKQPHGDHQIFTRGSGASKQTLEHWSNTGTTTTSLNHPKGPSHGNAYNTQLQRSNCDSATLGKLFENPRAHTGQGYFDKK